MLYPGDIIVGLKEADVYEITKYNTQWIVYDREGDNLLVAKVVPPDRYRELQLCYNIAEEPPFDIDMYWVDMKYFKFQHTFRVVNVENVDMLRTLNTIDYQLRFLTKEVL